VNPRAFVGSTVLHAGAIWLLFFFTPAASPRVAPSAIQVALVNLPEGALKIPAGEPVDVPPPPDKPEPKAKSPEETPPVKNAIRPPDSKAPPPKRPVAGVPAGSRPRPRRSVRRASRAMCRSTRRIRVHVLPDRGAQSRWAELGRAGRARDERQHRAVAWCTSRSTTSAG